MSKYNEGFDHGAGFGFILGVIVLLLLGALFWKLGVLGGGPKSEPYPIGYACPEDLQAEYDQCTHQLRNERARNFNDDCIDFCGGTDFSGGGGPDYVYCMCQNGTGLRMDLTINSQEIPLIWGDPVADVWEPSKPTLKSQCIEACGGDPISGGLSDLVGLYCEYEDGTVCYAEAGPYNLSSENTLRKQLYNGTLDWVDKEVIFLCNSEQGSGVTWSCYARDNSSVSWESLPTEDCLGGVDG